jgi:hypothetical protein
VLGLTRLVGIAVVLVALGWFTAPAPGTSRLAPCNVDALAPYVWTNGAGGTILVYVGLRNTTGRACVARARVTLALRNLKTRRLLRIDGNPHSQTMRGRLRAGKRHLFTMQWSNYCGPLKPLIFEATLGARRAAERSHYPGARCETADVPSRLRVFRLRR